MLTHPTSERLVTLGLTGMAKALDEQRRADATFEPLGFEDRLGLLVDREAAERDGKRLTARLKFAALRQAACVEDLDLRAHPASWLLPLPLVGLLSAAGDPWHWLRGAKHEINGHGVADERIFYFSTTGPSCGWHMDRSP